MKQTYLVELRNLKSGVKQVVQLEATDEQDARNQAFDHAPFRDEIQRIVVLHGRTKLERQMAKQLKRFI